MTDYKAFRLKRLLLIAVTVFILSLCGRSLTTRFRGRMLVLCTKSVSVKRELKTVLPEVTERLLKANRKATGGPS